MPHTNELRKISNNRSNLRETREILNFLKLWETQSSFKIFKKISGKILNSLLKVFLDLRKNSGKVKVTHRRFYDKEWQTSIY